MNTEVADDHQHTKDQKYAQKVQRSKAAWRPRTIILHIIFVIIAKAIQRFFGLHVRV